MNGEMEIQQLEAKQIQDALRVRVEKQYFRLNGYFENSVREIRALSIEELLIYLCMNTPLVQIGKVSEYLRKHPHTIEKRFEEIKKRSRFL